MKETEQDPDRARSVLGVRLHGVDWADIRLLLVVMLGIAVVGLLTEKLFPGMPFPWMLLPGFAIGYLLNACVTRELPREKGLAIVVGVCLVIGVLGWLLGSAFEQLHQ